MREPLARWLQHVAQYSPCRRVALSLTLVDARKSTLVARDSFVIANDLSRDQDGAVERARELAGSRRSQTRRPPFTWLGELQVTPCLRVQVGVARWSAGS